MPGWQGWKESEVRPSSTTAGFTAINAPVPQTNDAINAPRGQPAANVNELPLPISVVADYLGLGEAGQPAAIVSQALHGPGTKKAGGKGKKRASTSTATSNAKRRKYSDVSEGMSVTKPNTQEQDDAQHAPVAAKPKSKSKRKATAAATDRNVSEVHQVPDAAKLKAKQVPGVAATDQDLTEAAETARPVPVYSQATSMECVHSTPQSTSLDVVRGASGYGHTLYSSAPTSIGMQSGVELAHHRVKGAAIKLSPGAEFNTQRRRPCAARAPNLSPMESDDDPDVMMDSLPSQVSRRLSSRPQLPTPVNSDPAPSELRTQPKQMKKTPSFQNDEDFLELDDSDDEAMVGLAEEVEETIARRERTPPPRTVKQNTRAVDEHEDYGGALFSEAEKQLLDELRASTQDSANKPIVRKPFPPPVFDRSPVFGATNNTVLRTCFRVGEALNVGCHAVRTNKNVLLELYARVASSSREEKPGRKQHFVLKDLYHDKPPHVKGTFELWDQSRLWDLDSKAFLVPRKEGTMCRVVARMRRDGLKWKLEIFSIWEASWEDVEFVAGVYAKEGEASLLTVDAD